MDFCYLVPFNSKGCGLTFEQTLFSSNKKGGSKLASDSGGGNC